MRERATPQMITERVESARTSVDHLNPSGSAHVIVTLADDLAEARALLEDDNMPTSWPGSFCSYPLTEECCWTTGRARPCYQHGKRALIARTR